MCQTVSLQSSRSGMATVQAQLRWLKVVVKSGSLMEMAAHLTISLLLSCTDPVGPTTIPPSAFIVLIPNSRSNPSGLPCTTSTLILAELPSSVDTVTIPSQQHGWDMPPIIIMFTIALLQDRHRSTSMIVHKQPVSISAKHFAPST